jgi:hypothetical protein
MIFTESSEFLGRHCFPWVPVDASVLLLNSVMMGWSMVSEIVLINPAVAMGNILPILMTSSRAQFVHKI